MYKFKQLIALSVISIISLIAFSTSHAYFIDTVDVGELDILMGIKEKVNGDANELAWAEELTNKKLVINDTFPTVNYFETNVSNIFAFKTFTNPEYFLIKNSTWSALFDNNEMMNWGVFDAELLPGFNIPTDGYTISHVTEFDPTSIPEPSILLLLGIGLIGLLKRT